MIDISFSSFLFNSLQGSLFKYFWSLLESRRDKIDDHSARNHDYYFAMSLKKRIFCDLSNMRTEILIHLLISWKSFTLWIVRDKEHDLNFEKKSRHLDSTCRDMYTAEYRKFRDLESDRVSSRSDSPRHIVKKRKRRDSVRGRQRQLLRDQKTDSEKKRLVDLESDDVAKSRKNSTTKDVRIRRIESNNKVTSRRIKITVVKDVTSK